MVYDEDGRPQVGVIGTNRDFVWGFGMGFFMGFVMLFWVWMPSVPQRQKLGILSGICCQVALNINSSPRDSFQPASANEGFLAPI
jgi:hypothetical protein